MSAVNGLNVPQTPSSLQGALPGILGFFDNESAIRTLSAYQPTVAVARLNGVLAVRPGRVTFFRGKALVNGTVADTVIRLRKIPANGILTNAVDVATLTIGQAPADGLNTEGVVSTDPAIVSFVPGDLLYIEVTAAATGATDLVAVAGFAHSAL